MELRRRFGASHQLVLVLHHSGQCWSERTMHICVTSGASILYNKRKRHNELCERGCPTVSFYLTHEHCVVLSEDLCYFRFMKEAKHLEIE